MAEAPATVVRSALRRCSQRVVRTVDRWGAVRLTLVAFVGLQLVFVAVTLASALVPNVVVLAALKTSYVNGDFANEGFHFSSPDYPAEQTGAGLQLAPKLTLPIDRYTECVALDSRLAPTPGMNALAKPFFDSGPAECSDFYADWFGPPQRAGNGYFWYWNGVTSISRPILAVAGVGGFRLVSALALYAATGTLLLAVRRVAGLVVGLLLIGPWLVMTDFVDLYESIPHALSAAAMTAGAALVCEVARRRPGNGPLLFVVALAAGSVYNFIDLMTMPPGAWALTVAVAAISTGVVLHRARPVLLAAAAAGAGWLAGYAGTWVAKWIISAALFGPSKVWNTIRSVIGLQSGGNHLNGIGNRLKVPFVDTFQLWEHRPFVSAHLLVAVAVLTAGAGALIIIRHGWSEFGVRAATAVGALVVPVWFVVVARQTVIQDFYSYRSLAVALGIVLAGLAVRPRPAPVAPPREASSTPAARPAAEVIG